jgi:hypothetical protein
MGMNKVWQVTQTGFQTGICVIRVTAYSVPHFGHRNISMVATCA